MPSSRLEDVINDIFLWVDGDNPSHLAEGRRAVLPLLYKSHFGPWRCWNYKVLTLLGWHTTLGRLERRVLVRALLKCLAVSCEDRDVQMTRVDLCSYHSGRNRGFLPTHFYMRSCKCMQINTHIYTYAYTHTYVYACIHILVIVLISRQVLYPICVCVSIYIHIYRCDCLQMCTVDAHAYAHAQPQT